MSRKLNEDAEKPESQESPGELGNIVQLQIRVPQHPTPLTVEVVSLHVPVKTLKAAFVRTYNEQKKADAPTAYGCRMIGRGRELPDDSSLRSLTIEHGDQLHAILNTTPPAGEAQPASTADNRRASQQSSGVSSPTDALPRGFDQLLASGISREEVEAVRNTFMRSFRGLSAEEIREQEERFFEPVAVANRRRRREREQRRSESRQQQEPREGELTAEERAELEARAVRMVDPAEAQAQVGEGVEVPMPVETVAEAERRQGWEELVGLLLGIFLGPISIVFVNEAMPFKCKLSLGVGLIIHVGFALYGLSTYEAYIVH